MRPLTKSRSSSGCSEQNFINKRDNSQFQLDIVQKKDIIQQQQQQQQQSYQISTDTFTYKNEGEEEIKSNNNMLSNTRLASIASRMPKQSNYTLTNEEVETIAIDTSFYRDEQDNLTKGLATLDKTAYNIDAINQSFDVIINSPNSLISPQSQCQIISQVTYNKSDDTNQQIKIAKLDFDNQQNVAESATIQKNIRKSYFVGQLSNDNEDPLGQSQQMKESSVTSNMVNEDTNSNSKSLYQASQTTSKHRQNILKTKNDLIFQYIKKVQDEKQQKQQKKNGQKRIIAKLADNKGIEDKIALVYDSNQQNCELSQLPLIQATPIHHNKNYLLITLFIKNFINSILYILASKNYGLLQEKHYSIINDKSAAFNHNASYNSESKMKETKTMLEVYSEMRNKKKVQSHDRIIIFNQFKIRCHAFIEYILRCSIFRLRVLQPNSLILIVWDILLLLQLCLLYTIVPARISFSIKGFNEQEWKLFIYTIPLIFFLLDMFIGFHSGYYEYGFPVLQKKQVVLKYLKNKFWSDFVCIVLLLVDSSDFAYLFTLILRLKQVNVKVEKLNEHFQIQERFPTASNFTKLIIRVLYISHLFGCGFTFIGQVTKNDPLGCWLIKNDLLDKDWIEQYVFSIYFGIITMITIGYGDIYPINLYEKLFVILMTFISCGLFAYCVNSIGEIIREIKHKSEDFTQKKYVLSSYLNHMNISNHTKIRFLKYTEYIHHTTDELYIKGQQIFDSCPHEMREEVLKEYYGKKLLNFKTFKMHFSSQFLTQLSLKMKEQIIGPGESIVLTGQKLSKLYFINRDSDLEYYYNNGEFHRQLCHVFTHVPYKLQLHFQYLIQYIQFQTINKNNSDVVDLGLFFSEQPAEISIRTKSSMVVSFLCKEEFLETIKHFQNDFEIYSIMRNQFLNENRCDIKCSCCGKYSHSIGNCPQIHFTVRKETFCARQQFNFLQERNETYERKKMDSSDKFRALSLNHTVKHELKRVRLNYAKERHSFLNDADFIQELQFHQKDKYFFLNVPQINFQIDDNQIESNTTQNNPNSPHQNQCYSKFNQSSSSQSYSDDNESDSNSDSDSDTDRQSDSENNIQRSEKNNQQNDQTEIYNDLNEQQNDQTQQLIDLTQQQIDQTQKQIESFVQFTCSAIKEMDDNNEKQETSAFQLIDCQSAQQILKTIKEEDYKDEDIYEEIEADNKNQPLGQTFVKKFLKQKIKYAEDQYFSSAQQTKKSIDQKNSPLILNTFIHPEQISLYQNQIQHSQKLNEFDSTKNQLLNQKRFEREFQKRKKSVRLSIVPYCQKSENPKKKPKPFLSRQLVRHLNSPDSRNRHSNDNFNENIEKEPILKSSQNITHRSSKIINPEINSGQKETSRKSIGGARKSTKLSVSSIHNQEDVYNQSERLSKQQSIKYNLSNLKPSSFHELMITIMSSLQEKIPQSDSKRQLIKSETIIEVEGTKDETNQQHIFGALKFSFDKVKEFQLFYPQFNYTSVLRRLRKKQQINQMQLKIIQAIKPKKQKV